MLELLLTAYLSVVHRGQEAAQVELGTELSPAPVPRTSDSPVGIHTALSTSTCTSSGLDRSSQSHAMALNQHLPAPHSLRVQIATFNYNLRGSTQYDTPDLEKWLVPTKGEDGDSGYVTDVPDIYAIGFQELMPLHVGFSGVHGDTSVLVPGETAGEVMSETDAEIRRAIRPHSAITSGTGQYPSGGGPEGYTLIARAHLVGLALFVYARERNGTVARVKEVRINHAATGLLNLLGNKGAVGARIVLGGSQESVMGTGAKEPDQVLTFACGHLAAHDHNIKRRNRDWKNIVERLVFPPDSVVPLPMLQTSVSGGRGGAGPADLNKLQAEYSEKPKGKNPSTRPGKALDSETYTLYDSSNLFVLGDLNYRIAVDTPPISGASKNARGTLKKKDVGFKVVMEEWDLLAAYDQLTMERLGGRVFHGLTESHLGGSQFGPTYKFKVDKKANKIIKKAGSSAGAGAAKKKKSAMADVGLLSQKRIPGWTDRILWRSWADGKDEPQPKSSGAIEVELYRSIMTYTVRRARDVAIGKNSLTLVSKTALRSQTGDCDCQASPATFEQLKRTADRLQITLLNRCVVAPEAHSRNDARPCIGLLLDGLDHCRCREPDRGYP